MHGPTTTANDNPSYFPPQPAAAAEAHAAMSEQQQHYQQYENSDAQLSQPPSSSATGYGLAMMDQHGTSTNQQHHQVPITTTTNRHVSDYSDSFEWEGTYTAQRYTSHPNSSTDSFYQPLSFGTRQHQRQQNSSSSPFGSLSDSQSTYFAQPAVSNIPSGPAAASQTLYDPQTAPASTHNVFAQSGLSQSSAIGIASAPGQQGTDRSYMAIDTSISTRLEQESEGYLSPSSSEPMAATRDPSQFFSPLQASVGGNQYTSLSTFGRSASPSPSVSCTSTNYNNLYNTSLTFPPSSSTYRNTNYSSSGGLSDSSMDMDDSSSLKHYSNNPLLKQELHRNGKPKRPLNSFMIFARQRRPDLQKLNPNMKVADIAKELSKEWKDMPAEKKKEYFEAAKVVKESFHKMHPDYVYSRRPNGSRKSGSGGGGGGPSTGHRRRASSATPSSSGSTTGGGTAADIGESTTMLSHSLSLSSLPSANHHATTSSHRGKTRSRPLAGSKGAGAGASQSGVRSSDSERSAFSPGYESNTSDAEMGNLHMPMPMRMPADLSQAFSFHSAAGTPRDEGTSDSFRSLATGYEPHNSSSSAIMDYDAPPLQQAQMSSSTSSAPGYLETHMSANTQNYQGSSNAVQPFEEQLLSQRHPAQIRAQEQSSGSIVQSSLQASNYPSSSIGHQQLSHGNIFATPEPRQQQSSAASHVLFEGFPTQEQPRPSTAQSGYSQAPITPGAATPSMQGRPTSSSRFGIHSFRNAGPSSSSTRPPNTIMEQSGVHASLQGGKSDFGT